MKSTKRNPLLKTVLGVTMLCALTGTATIASALVAEPATKEAPVEAVQDAKAIEIIENSIEQSGGKDLIEGAESIHTTGTIEIPMAGLSGTMEFFAAEGGNLFIKVDIPGVGEQLSGLRDGIGWSIDAMNGPKLLEEEMITDLVEQADPQVALKFKQRYSTITYVGETEFNGTKAHQIDYISKASGKASTEYYSTETGLLAGSVATTASEMGDVTITTTVTEYAEFAGFKLPSKTIQKMGPMSFNINTDAVEFNAVDNSVFEFPVAIKALIEAAKEDG